MPCVFIPMKIGSNNYEQTLQFIMWIRIGNRHVPENCRDIKYRQNYKTDFLFDDNNFMELKRFFF